MLVRITILASVNSKEEDVSYVASCATDCQDAADRAAYEMACMLGEVVTCGSVIAEPVRG